MYVPSVGGERSPMDGMRSRHKPRVAKATHGIGQVGEEAAGEQFSVAVVNLHGSSMVSAVERGSDADCAHARLS
jgi:hypothetical protein